MMVCHGTDEISDIYFQQKGKWLLLFLMVCAKMMYHYISIRLIGEDRMKKIDQVVRKETKYIAIWVVIFSMAMQAVFLAIGAWNITVLLGNLLSGVAVTLNFLAMGITIQNAVTKEEKDAKQLMKLSGSLRLLLLFVVVVIGAALPCFDIWAVVIPLLFPRVAIAIRPAWDRRKDTGGETEDEK